MLQATNERPWLWVLFVIVVILPFVLIAVCCFPGSKVNVQSSTGKNKNFEVVLHIYILKLQKRKTQVVMVGFELNVDWSCYGGALQVNWYLASVHESVPEF